MTKKQQRFVDNFATSANASEAARRAGYSQKNADVVSDRLMKNPAIREAVAATREVLAEKAETSALTIMRELEQMQLSALADGQYTAAIRAAELRGKHIGMFIERKEITGKDGAPVMPAIVMFDAVADDTSDS